MPAAISVRNLSKCYRLHPSQGIYGYRSLRESIGAKASMLWKRNSTKQVPAAEFWALKDVSFEIQPGEVAGIIGGNGAGKSTLLKVLSRITSPTSGSAEIRGRVGSLLEVGTGFHPELSGRENVYLAGAILGMKKSEIDQRFDEIVAFAEVERFLDTPVKHYSSGMYMRLAFAVAAHLETEILLVDEVLAVGDAAFQQKCLRRMSDVATGGRTIMFVSHNMPAVLNICNRGVVLSRGTVEIDSDPDTAVATYLRGMSETTVTSLAGRGDRKGNGRLRFTNFRLLDASLKPVPCVRSGQQAVLGFEYEGNSRLSQVDVAIGLHGRYDEHLFHLATDTVESDFPALPRRGEILCVLPALPLQPGSYVFNLFCTVGGDIADWIQHAGRVEVEGGDFFGTGRLPPVQQGPFLVDHSWSFRAA